MQDVKVSDSLRASVLQHAAEEREWAGNYVPREAANFTTPSLPSRARRAKPTPRIKRPVLKAFATAACLAVLLTGVAGALTLSTWQNMPLGGLDAGGENSFALRAYATENAGGEASAGAQLESGNFGWGGYSGAYYDPETKQFAAYDEWGGYKFAFNVDCVGNNIKTVDYVIEGEKLYFETMGGSPSFKYTDSISLDYNNQHTDDEPIVSIYLGFPVPEAARELFYLPASERTDRFFYDYSTALDIAAVQALAGSRLTLTATYTDGSTETKTYTFEPVANFETLCADYWTTTYDSRYAYESTAPENKPSPPSKPALLVLKETV